MKLEQAHIAQIKTAFQAMQSKEDFLHLLNAVKPFVYGKKAISFEMKQLTWHANPQLGGQRYVEFVINKKSGGDRKILAPVNGLKAIQRTINLVLQCVYEPSAAAMGFVKDRSIITNANMHIGHYYVYNIDLKDFFPSIDQARVWKTLQLKPFNLIGTNRLEIANLIASLCCAEMEVERKNETGEWRKTSRKVLPQGAPTSPIISNIVCQKLDFLLLAVAKRFGLTYSRYADDITFSSLHNVYQPDGDFLKELNRIIAQQNFHVKESKTRLQKEGYRMEVTGLTVNEKANVQQRYIKQLRAWLYYWERYGFERASEFFAQQYLSDKTNVIKGMPDMAKVISGKLEYLKMVKGEENEMYQMLKSRFKKITGQVDSKTKTLTEVEQSEARTKSFQKLLLDSKEQIIDVEEKNIVDILIAAKIEETTIPIIHKPKELVALLKNFSVNDSALKYTTHSWDAGRDANMFKDLSEFLSIAKSQYSEFSYALKGLSENLNGKIYNFLFNKEIAKSGWGDNNKKKRIYFGWSSPELLEACENDISLNPEDLILPEQFQIQRSGKTLQKFKHIIDVFKNEIEIRDENSALLNLILQKHDNYLISFSAPQVSNLENKTFYTDIQWLSKALDLIFKGIQDRPQHQDVEYFVTENNSEKLILNILHKNSFKKGVSICDEKLNLTRGDFGPIKNYLMNLCDWSIESVFAEGAYRINYLVSDNEIPAYEKVISAEGFKHILTFYK